MKVPKEIAEKARAYQEATKVADQAFEEVCAWLNENTDADGVYINDLFIVDTPTGKEQDEGEYCDQHSVGWCEDSYEGKYYHPIEGSHEYLGYHYEC